MKTRTKRGKSASPSCVSSIEPEAYQREQAESLGQQGNNSKIVDMIRKMDQRMLERDIQLRAQLKERDQYFEEEIRKRDLFIDETIKQRYA